MYKITLTKSACDNEKGSARLLAPSSSTSSSCFMCSYQDAMSPFPKIFTGPSSNLT